MAGFGGAVKLTGESEYRKALQLITQNLKEVSAEMKVVSSAYDKNDKSATALKAQQDALNKVLMVQTDKLVILKAQYDAMAKQYADQTAKHNQLVQTYNSEKEKLEEIGRTLGTTSKEYQDQKAKVDDLAQEVRKSTSAQDANEKSMSKMRIEISNAQADCNGTAKAMENLGQSVDQTSGDFTVFKGILADLGSKAIQSAISGVKQLGTALVNVGKQSYSSYASYEQLVGGVETLFGESADQLLEYAQKAYLTAGLSANEYMEQATGFSATLLQGLEGDTESAVKYADMAIKDMSDNANKMGTAMANIQNAYQGFAKDNYTMLDNLKLGYGGNKTEMARLINDSGVLGDTIEVTAKTLNEVPFDKVIEAIHVIQQQIGITGTTTKEAEFTIEGSTKAMAGAWKNLLTAIADPDQDVGELIDQFVSSAISAGKNAIPRIRNILQGMGEVFSALWNEVLPDLREQVPELTPLFDVLQWIKDNGNTIISILAGIVAGLTAFKIAGVITTLVSAFSTLFTVLKSGTTVMQLLNGVFMANPIGIIAFAVAGLVATFATLWKTSEKFRNFWINLWENIKTAFTTAWGAITVFFTETIPEAFNNVKETIGGWIDTVVQWFAELPDKVTTFVTQMIESISTWFAELPYKIGYFLGEVIGKIILWGAEAVEWLKTNVPLIIESVVTFFSELPSKIWAWLVNAYNKIIAWGKDTKTKAVEAGRDFLTNFVQFVQQLPSRIWSFLTTTISNVATFAVDIATKAKEGAVNLFNNIVNTIKELPEKVMSIGSDIVRGIWNGITNMTDWIGRKLKGFATGLLDGIKDALGIESPSKVFRDQVGKNLALGIGEGFEDEMKSVADGMSDAIPKSFNASVSGSGSSYPAGQELTYITMVDAFKDALSQMKIELDDDEVGRFVDRTVTRLVYS